MHAIRVEAVGGPEVLRYVEIETPRPSAGEVLVHIEAIGINYVDVYHRTGLYKMALPFTPGSEAAGTVAEVGPEVTGFFKGDRVAYAMIPGAYAEYAVVPAAKLVVVPKTIDTRTAAAVMVQGMTAHYLATSTHALKSGDTAIVHAAAGGVGGLLVQIAKKKGARVFGTASTPKLQIVRDDGADVVIDYTKEDFESVVMQATEGKGVNVVYDSVGKTTFDKSLNCVALRGLLALFGQSSGPVPPFDPARLAKNGTYLTRPSLAHYMSTRGELLWRANDVFDMIAAGTLKVRIDRDVPLPDAAEAHRALESRQTIGKILLIP
ncbi:MAG TPA: quinone oxidoreductase [Thermoanaerobaculia bacterium]|jgi:NADPH2:quinone reductase|nr:quinone oxidoreductase [Thermoanaerobaculia bacterium]